MTFGRRTQSAAQSAPRLLSVRSRRAAVAPPRRGGYLLALASACVAFALSLPLTVAMAFAVSENATASPARIVIYGLVGAGPVLAITYAICLAAADVLLRLAARQSIAAYGVAVPALSSAILMAPVMLLHRENLTLYYVLLIIPGAACGGLVLGWKRRTPTPAPVG